MADSPVTIGFTGRAVATDMAVARFIAHRNGLPELFQRGVNEPVVQRDNRRLQTGPTVKIADATLLVIDRAISQYRQLPKQSDDIDGVIVAVDDPTTRLHCSIWCSDCREFTVPFICLDDAGFDSAFEEVLRAFGIGRPLSPPVHFGGLTAGCLFESRVWKLGGRWKFRRQRHFILFETELRYYSPLSRHSPPTLKGSIPLASILDVEGDRPGKPGWFYIHTTYRIYECCAATLEEAGQWVVELLAAAGLVPAQALKINSDIGFDTGSFSVVRSVNQEDSIKLDLRSPLAGHKGPVAIKYLKVATLAKDFAPADDELEEQSRGNNQDSLRSEIELLSRMPCKKQHPNIIKYLGHGRMKLMDLPQEDPDLPDARSSLEWAPSLMIDFYLMEQCTATLYEFIYKRDIFVWNVREQWQVKQRRVLLAHPSSIVPRWRLRMSTFPHGSFSP